MTWTGEKEMRSSVRAQMRATKCCCRPERSHRPQSSEMQPKQAVAAAISGMAKRLVKRRRGRGMVGGSRFEVGSVGAGGVWGVVVMRCGYHPILGHGVESA